MIPGACRRLLAIEERLPLNVLFGYNKKWMGMQHSLVKAKPPNIVIVTQKVGNFSEWKSLLEKLLSQNTYVIYNLDRNELFKAYWTDNVALFLLDYVTDLEEKECKHVENFIKRGGNALIHCSAYPNKDVQKNGMSQLSIAELVFNMDDCCHYFSGFVNQLLMINCDLPGSEALCCTKAEKRSVLSYEKVGSGNLVVSALDMLASLESSRGQSQSNFEKPSICELLKLLTEKLQLKQNEGYSLDPIKLAPGYLFGQLEVLFKEEEKMEKDFTIKIVNCASKIENVHASPSFFPIISCGNDFARDAVNQHFNINNYWKHLATTNFGRIVIYSKAVTSTQFIMERMTSSLPFSCNGLLLIAGQQLHGKGRGGNKWLSPDGCMMFSLALNVNVSSQVGKRLPFLQHIASVAVVNSVREIPGYEGLMIGIKWPNDVYFGQSVKIGGLIVNSSFSCGEFRCTVGIGLNISNRKPTICLNSIIDQHNIQHGTNLTHLPIEEVIARTLTNIEKLLEVFEKNGHIEFLDLYYKYWLHNNQRIRLGNDDGEHVIIKGLDDNGFLLVERRTGENISVQPDGNSFDMLKGLISVKMK